MFRIGLDVGGTFTDVVALDEQTGATSWYKVPTNVESPSVGVIDAIEATGVSFADIDTVRLGTTLGVNAILTRSGVRTGLLTTAGFRDVLEIRRTHRERLFDLNERMPEPLVPRDLRLEVDERVDAEGRIVRTLDEDGVRRASLAFRDSGVKAIAVVFLFSFENPVHERRARDILLADWEPDEVFISSDVLPAYREYERTSTTVVAAHIAGTVESYLRELGSELEARGVDPERLSIMTNAGGSLSVRTVAKLPIATLLSGPVGGVEAARWLADQAGFSDVLTLDMGGTSCDVSGIVGGVADERLDMVVDGHTICYPTFDIETIGAGGGSIAWIDSGGSLRVGPKSAGSRPGPASYGRGGSQPTVTDANLVLGRYEGGSLLGGSLRLDADLARAAIATHVAGPLGMTVEAAAMGIVRIVNVNMTNAVRMISVERGRDVRDFTLVAFGGAGPAHAAEIARELSIPRVLIPPFPGCTSAFGALISNSRRDFVRTIGRATSDVDVGSLAKLARALVDEASSALAAEGIPLESRTVEVWMDLRYAGQAHDISVRHPELVVTVASLDIVSAAFNELHGQLYGHAFDDVPVEVVNLRIKGFGRRSQTEAMWWSWEPVIRTTPESDASRPVFFEAIGGFVDAAVVMREDLTDGDDIYGPAVIHQRDSTVVVPPGFVAEVLQTGSLMLRPSNHLTELSDAEVAFGKSAGACS